MEHLFDKNHEPVSYRMPMFLYRYQIVGENFFAGLRESYLWFSPPPALNDPLDCANILSSDNSLKDLRRYCRRYIDPNPVLADARAQDLHDDVQARRKIAQQLYDLRIAHVNICCFSNSPTASLLWSHYADGHRGVVAIYAAPLLVHESEVARFSIIGVRYQRIPPKYNTIREQLKYGDSGEYHFRFDQTVLGTKTSEWAYEKETRLISPQRGKNYFNKKAFVGVICGHKMPKDVASEINYKVYESYPDANVFYQELNSESGKITAPGTEAFEEETVEIQAGGWNKLDDART